MATSPSRLHRRVRLAVVWTLAAAAVVAAVMWLARPEPETGLVVHVLVVDPEGRPVAGAEAQRIFAPGWVKVDAEGRARLAGVPLRVDERPSAEAIARALEVRASRHAPRAGMCPEVQRREDGTWETRLVVEPFGIARLVVRPTHLPAVRATLTARPRGSIEAVDGVAVARPGQPAQWRVFAEAEALEAALHGATGVVVQSREVDLPSPGFVREITLIATKARPIRGRIVPPEGVDPPTLEGGLVVTELSEDGREWPRPPVAITPDGTFEIPYAGEARYRLEPYAPGPESGPVFLTVAPRVVEGGDEVLFEDVDARPWFVVAQPPGAPRPSTFVVGAARLDAEGAEGATLYGDDTAHVALPGPGRWRVWLERSGAEGVLPLWGEVFVDVTGPGPWKVAIPVEELPAADLIVRVGRADGVSGAHVDLREPSRPKGKLVLFEFGSEARFSNVRAGPVEVRVTWQSLKVAPWSFGGEFEAGRTLELEAPAREGGRLVLEGRGPALHSFVGPLELSWERGPGPSRKLSDTVTLDRVPRTARWHLATSLAPGTYEGLLRGGPHGTGTRRVTFEIRAGETTVVPFRLGNGE